MRVNATRSIATALTTGLACLLTACTTMRPLTADAAGEKIREALKPGDAVHVPTKGGANHSFEVTEIGAASLLGKTVKMFGVGSTDTWGAPIEIPYADIAQIEVRRVEGLKTAILAVVLVVAADVSINSARGSKHCCISAAQ